MAAALLVTPPVFYFKVTRGWGEGLLALLPYVVIGGYLILDGAWAIMRREHKISFQMARIFRIIVGVSLILYHYRWEYRG